jgi:hypothetical protein
MFPGIALVGAKGTPEDVRKTPSKMISYFQKA